MKERILFLTVIINFLYADISNILIKIDKIESYKPVFKHIVFNKKCKKKILNQLKFQNNIHFKLKAIFDKKALINNEWVKEGDFIKNFQVLKIFPKKVILKNENKIVILKFNNNLLKVQK